MTGRPPTATTQAVLLGLVQGATEVWPVSSSAHLALVPRLLGWPQPAHRTALAAGLHVGSAVGLTWALRADLRALRAVEWARLAASSLPAAAAGVLAADAVERRLGGPRATPALLATAGVALWLADREPPHGGPRPPGPHYPGPGQASGRAEHLPSAGVVGPGRHYPGPGQAYGRAKHLPSGGVVGLEVREALVGGLAQVAALAPGVSRSGAVLTALRAAGVPRERALRASLLLSLPLTGGAALLPLARLARRDPAALRALAGPLAVGVPAAAVSAVTVLRCAPPRRLGAVALYRLGLAATAAAAARRGSA